LHPDEPLAIGGYLPIDKVYAYEPIPEELPADKQQHILGAQANLWTEYIPDFAQLQYMAYPRGAAMAEVLWSAKEQRDYADFSKRLIHHFQRYAAAGIHAASAFFEVAGEVVSKNGQIKASLASADEDATIHYTLDGTPPSPQSETYSAPFEITQTGDIMAATFVDGIQKGRLWKQSVHLHKAVGKPINLKDEPAERYGAGGKGIILNGIYGNENHFGGEEWLGFEGKDVEAVIDLGELTALSSLKFRFFQQNGAWIYLPKKVSVYASSDGQNYQLAGVNDAIQTEGKVASPEVAVDVKATHLKIRVERFGIIPEGKTGANHEAWLFVGEIEVN
jgi:hexosaminidase